MKLANKIAVVTGAGSGIGRALALTLADRGCDLALSDINEANAAETARLAEAEGAKTHVRRLDVADRDAVMTYAKEVVDVFGRVNVVVNNAGIASDGTTIASVDTADFDRVMAINLGGVVNGTWAFLPHLVNSGDGALVNISSINGVVAQPGLGPYCASKFAVRGFTEVVRSEMVTAGANVKVTVVHPGGIATNIASGGLERAQAESREISPAQRKRAELYNEKLLRMDPLQAAKIIVEGVEKDRPRVLVGNDARTLDLLARLVPKQLPWIMGKMEKRVFGATV